MPGAWTHDTYGSAQITAAVDEQEELGAHGHARIHEVDRTKQNFPTTGMTTVSEDASVDISAGQKMISAMTGSLLTSLLVTPLDVVRVRLQSQPLQQHPLRTISKLAQTSSHAFATPTSTPSLGVTACCREVFFATNTAEQCLAIPKIDGLSRKSSTVDCAVEETQRKTFTTTLDGLRKIARNEGLTTLWRGLSPTLAMTVPGNIIYFTGYDWLRFSRNSPINKLFSDSYAPLVAGSAARILAAVVVSPIEMFRTRMQASRSTTTSLFTDTFRGLGEMTATHGYLSLWRGLALTLWRDVPFSGLYWWGYETIRGTLTEVREERRGRSVDLADTRTQVRSKSHSRERHTATFLDSFVSGAISGAIASVVTTPFDVGKTRQQVFIDEGPSTRGVIKNSAPEAQSMLKFLLHIFKVEGFAGLFRGWVPRTLKVAPACAIMISSYEVGKLAFRTGNARAELRRTAV